AEVVEVGRHVPGEAVERDPAPHADADRGDLAQRPAFGADPHAGPAGIAASLDAEASRGADHRLLEATEIAVEIALAVAQAEDRIGDELPRSVERGFAAATDAVDRHAEPLRRAAKMRRVRR